MDGSSEPLKTCDMKAYNVTSSCPKCGNIIETESVHWEEGIGLQFVYVCKPCKTRYVNV